MVRAGPAPYPLIYEPRRLPCHNRVYRLARGGGRAGGGGGVVGGEVGERVTRDVARRYLRPGRLFTKRSVGSRPCRMTPVDTRAFGRNLIVSFARHRESAPHTRLLFSADTWRNMQLMRWSITRRLECRGIKQGTSRLSCPRFSGTQRWPWTAYHDASRFPRILSLLLLSPCLSSSLCNTFYRSTKLLSRARKIKKEKRKRKEWREILEYDFRIF